MPPDPKEGIKRKFTKLIDENRQKTKDGELTQHNYGKRHTRLLNQMNEALEKVDVDQRMREFKKERKDHKQEL